MKFGYGSGSESPDPYLWLMDPDPAIFDSDLQDSNKKVFLLITFWRNIYITCQREKVIKKSQNSRNQGYSYYFCLMIDGSGSRMVLADPDPGGPNTYESYGSGSGSATLNLTFTNQLMLQLGNGHTNFRIQISHRSSKQTYGTTSDSFWTLHMRKRKDPFVNTVEPDSQIGSSIVLLI